MPDVPGYRIEGEAGRGGWSVVYRAVEDASGATVALKTIAPELSGDPVFSTLFRRECEILASLEHPHVPAVHGYGDGWVAMEWIAGGSLRELAPIAPERAVALLEQVAGALDLMHGRGLVHRDVKPGNVLVGPGERAYLTDFGLTKEISPDPGLTDAGRWLGTVDFSAPEQIRGHATDARSDVYSLACTLWYALTGSVPYPRETKQEAMQAHLHDAAPQLPEPLSALQRPFELALSKNPDWRFQSAGDFVAALADALTPPAAQEQAAPAPGAEAYAEPAPSAPSGSHRGRWIAAALALLAGAIVAVALATGDGGGGETTTEVERPTTREAGTAPEAPPPPSRDVEIDLGPEGNFPYEGNAFINEKDRRYTVTVEVQIDEAPPGQSYELWLYNDPNDAISLGTAAPNNQGLLLTSRQLPKEFVEYESIQLSLEPARVDQVHSGQTVLSGDLAELTGLGEDE